jgi:hypothetical protein
MNVSTDGTVRPPLSDEVGKWFEKEGYPLEFRTAQVFKRNGFHTLQGYYCHGQGENLLEIDVLANVDADLRKGSFFRVSYVVECKWSKDKPWVVFTSPDSWILESACIAQTVASRLGEAVTYCLAGDRTLQQLDTFVRREKGGFGGRRAFEKRESDREDQFYRAVQSVVNKAVTEAKHYDEESTATGPMPAQGALVFPLIVVEGELFEAYYDQANDKFEMLPTNLARLYWRGSKAHHHWIAPVDIVKFSALDEFARVRKQDSVSILKTSAEALESIAKGFEQKSLSAVGVKRGPRGYVGLPPLLRELYLLGQSANTQEKS